MALKRPLPGDGPDRWQQMTADTSLRADEQVFGSEDRRDCADDPRALMLNSAPFNLSGVFFHDEAVRFVRSARFAPGRVSEGTVGSAVRGVDSDADNVWLRIWRAERHRDELIKL